MKKVLFFLESLAGGGAEKVLTDIVCHMDRTKYDITVCTVTDGGVYEDQVSEACTYRSLLKMEDYHSGGMKKILFWLKLKMIYSFPIKMVYRWFLKERYDVEIAFIEGFATKLIAASPNAHSKKIAWVHSDLNANSYADSCYKGKNAQTAAYRKYDRILCVSESVKEAFEHKFFSGSQIGVQYNPVDEKAIIQKAHEPLSLQRSNPGLLLGTVGRLEQQKGYIRLLNCVKDLHDQGYSFTLWIIGKGSQQAQMEQFIQEKGLENTVLLLGFHKNPYQYLMQCDAFICSSYAEGFSTAATESLILGKPVFTVECAGMQELIGDSGCGEIVPNTDEALYQLLEKLVSNQFDLKRYSEQAEKRGKEFCMDTRISEIQQIISAESEREES